MQHDVFACFECEPVAEPNRTELKHIRTVYIL